MESVTKIVDDVVSSTNNLLNRTIRDVCQIFKEVTGMEARPEREGGAIAHWVKTESWGNFEFRALIEYEFKDPNARRYYLEHPSRLNLRSMFSPSRKEILLDILNGLRFQVKLEEEKKTAIESTPDLKITYLLAKCGAKVPLMHHKIPDNSTPKKFRWKQHLEAYDRHSAECFAAKGACFFP